MPAALIREQVGAKVWQTYFKFCVIRNPFEKAISGFYFGRDPATVREWNTDRVASEFGRWLSEIGPPLDRDVYTIDGKICMDAFIRYEHLARDLESICTRVGVPYSPKKLPRFKAGIRPPTATAQTIYTSESRRLVADHYAFELEHFGYSPPELDFRSPSPYPSPAP